MTAALPLLPLGVEMLLEGYVNPLGVGQVEAVRTLGCSLNRLNSPSNTSRAFSALSAA
ncbi:hypothetical protein LuPra_05171 [Luteitalea pratensis]|uniref:Uncharacterized protein n=1 Tax=Luteitalea pratensis TaxID=1855912 RepID=A0A143PUQ5_LUTPR|nr:hypothetical protein [Luteitalea pratensis]AMY11903.1 hypothetical protein LuPra_05171 [Luteitalea pratensis]